MVMVNPASIDTFPMRGWADVAESINRALLAQSGLVGVALVDIDHFFDLSQQVIAQTGDTADLVSAVTERLAGLVGPTTVAARVGDDAFALVQHPLTGPAEMEGLGLRIVEKFHDPVAVGHRRYQFTVSVGVATSHHRDSAKSLLRYAQYALDDAKATGRNRMIAFSDEDRELLKDID
jgi:Amt family ammonium transporter